MHLVTLSEIYSDLWLFIIRGVAVLLGALLMYENFTNTPRIFAEGNKRQAKTRKGKRVPLPRALWGRPVSKRQRAIEDEVQRRVARRLRGPRERLGIVDEY